MLQSFRDLYKIIKNDPTISPEIPIVRKLALRTFKWLLIAELIMVLQFYPMKSFMDELSTTSPDTKTLLAIAAAMSIVFFVSNLVNKRKANFRSDPDYRLWRGWWGFAHRIELRLSSDFHKMFGTGEKESLVGKNINRFEVMVDEFIFETLPATLRILFSTILMLLLSWQLGLVAVATVLVFAVVLVVNEKQVHPYRKEMQKGFKKLERFGTEMTNNWATIKSLGLEEDISDRNEEMLMSFIKEQKHRTRIFSKMEVRQLHVIVLSRAVLYGLIAWQFTAGQSIGTVVLATIIMERAVYVSFMRYSNFQRTANEGMEALRELIDVMTLEPTVKQSDQPVYKEDLAPVVRFENVGFAYPDEPENEKLSKFSLSVPAFSTTAITGQSGGGKSTVASLLLREYDPTAGRILIDDIDLKQLDYYRYRREVVSVVSQNIQLFDGTILDNIRMGLPRATDEECIEAAKQAHAHEFIAKLKNGYQTEIGENGVRLSGGQRQRLAIARALVRNPLILVLDEATSALDPKSQAIVQQTLDELTAARRMTIVIIAHRYSTIEGADQVAVMSDGQLEELGTHEELEAKNGLYVRLRNMESNGLLG